MRARQQIDPARPKVLRRMQRLIVRRTRATVAVAREFERQLRLAWPAHPADALGSLTGTAAWPGATFMWVAKDSRHVRMLSTRA